MTNEKKVTNAPKILLGVVVLTILAGLISELGNIFEIYPYDSDGMTDLSYYWAVRGGISVVFCLLFMKQISEAFVQRHWFFATFYYFFAFVLVARELSQIISAEAADWWYIQWVIDDIISYNTAVFIIGFLTFFLIKMGVVKPVEKEDKKDDKEEDVDSDSKEEKESKLTQARRKLAETISPDTPKKNTD